MTSHLPFIRTGALALALAFGVAALPMHAQTAVQGIRASTATPTHPILIRNEHGPMNRVVIEVEKGVQARIQSLSFGLDGTEDLHDLELLRLLYTGVDEAFSAKNEVGKSAPQAGTITFPVDMPLVIGRNVFWLSGRLRESAGLLRHVAARCVSVKTTAGDLLPADLTPGRRLRTGVALRKAKDDGVHTYRIPALATSAKGTLLAVYDMRRGAGRDLQGDIDTGLSRSTDGGQTWEPVRVIMDMGEYGGLPQEQNGCSDPGIVIDQQTGEIFCFAVWMNGKPGKHQWIGDGSEPGFEIGTTAQLMMVRSRDDGKTWSAPVNLTRKLKKESWWLFAPSPQSGIQLPDGTLVMPVQGREGPATSEMFATLMISRDHGETWTVGTPAYRGGCECQAARLGDGSIMLNMRNVSVRNGPGVPRHERFRAVAVTKDLGQTWQMHPTSGNTLMEPICNASLLRVGSKPPFLLFANPRSQSGRTNHTLQVSFDDGLTWPPTHHRLFDEGKGAGYPSLTQIDAKHVGIVYEGSQAQLTFQKFEIDEIAQPVADARSR